MGHLEGKFYARYRDHVQTIETLKAHKTMVQLEEELLDHIEKTDQEKAEYILNDILYRFVRVPYDNLTRTIQLYLTGFVAHITRRQALYAGIDAPTLAAASALISVIDDCSETAELIDIGPWFVDQLIQLHNSLTYLSAANPYVNEAILYIEEHIFEQLTLDKIADAVGITPTYLSHLFKEEMNMPMNSHINKRKIESAARDLAHTDWSLREISERYGYSNQSHFSLLFKKFKDIKPIDYRKTYQKSPFSEKV